MSERTSERKSPPSKIGCKRAIRDALAKLLLRPQDVTVSDWTGKPESVRLKHEHRLEEYLRLTAEIGTEIDDD